MAKDGVLGEIGAATLKGIDVIDSLANKRTLAKQVLEHAAGLPEGTPLVSKELLHLGSRAAVDQVLSRLVQRGNLLRAGRGIFLLSE